MHQRVSEKYIPGFVWSVIGAFALNSPFFVVSGEVPMVMVAYVWGNEKV